jgi:hypothetical protein
MRGFGKRLASLDIFRRLLQSVSDEDMDFGFERRILEAGDLMAANRGDGLSLGTFDKLRRVRRGIGKIGLLRNLQKAAGLMKRISRLYDSYPSRAEGLEQWNHSVEDVISSAQFD